jgi:UPF0755 protein
MSEVKVQDPENPARGEADHSIEREYRSREILGWNDEEVIRVRGVWYRIARAAIALLVVVAMIWFAYGRARSWFDAQLDPPGEPGIAVDLVVPAGATTADIARQLEDENIIPNSTFFRYYARVKNQGNFQAGEYVMAENSSVQEAIAVLNAGPKPHETVRFTVPEGLWVPEILATIDAQLDGVTYAQLDEALQSGRIPARYRPEGNTSWEGLLYPETYEVNTDDTADEVLLKMTDEFAKVTGSEGFGAAETLSGYSAYDVLIVASLVEAEAQRPEERPLVAAVIYNRLREGWILGIDATCVYAKGQRGVPLTTEDLETPGPYNCRLNAGLPPTPINSPGAASLEAALRPADVPYMYYVLTGEDGSHTFATTEEEFVAAKAICQEKGLC